jgi:phosphoenolpyruvate---glycerone phosphotransferase subunit DhaK
MKKLINDPNHVPLEVIEGLCLAYPQYVRQVPETQAVVRTNAPIVGEVAIVTGGGSGHEPMFAGYVGPGMAHASVAGNIFTSPPPNPIYETAKAAHGGRGVLFVYGNYAGDALNFDVAAEMLADDGIAVRTVRVIDDVASAPSSGRGDRRGIAGDLFVIKVAGARAAEGASLYEVASAAEKANENTRSMGVALSSCVIPASGRPIFQIGENELELGLGIHGEPGVERIGMLTADQAATRMVEPLLQDLQAKPGTELAVMVNGLGATSLAELLIVARAAVPLFAAAGSKVIRSFVGNYTTSLDMAGCSITAIRLDSETRRLLLAPAQSPSFMQM